MAYESTTVAVSKSQDDIRRLLVKHGASRFEFGEATDENGRTWAALGFSLNARSVRMRVPLKLIDEKAAVAKARRARSKTLSEVRGELNEQEAKRIWRVLAWNLKARLEAVEEGVETFEEAFLAHLLDERTGLTVYEQLARYGTVELDDVPTHRLLEAGS